MKRIGLYLALFLLLPITAFAETAAPEPDPFHNWQVYYYLGKDTSQVPAFLKWLQQSGTLERHPGATATMGAFLSIVFAENPAQVENWSHVTTFTGKARQVIDYALKPPVTPEAQVIKTPYDFDMMWGAFYASGNELYLRKIVDALDKSKPLTGDAKADATTRTAALAVFGANMMEHEAVERFLVSESAKRTDAVGEALKNIVASVRKQRDARQFPDHDGEFSAIVVVADPEVAAQQIAHASGKAVHIKEELRARPGDKRTLVIIFAGMQLMPDYSADVTYDVQLIDPKGKLYSDLKDVEAIKQKVPTRFHLFNNRKAVFINFDHRDTPGRYKVYVTLKDNVGKKSIQLIKALTLTHGKK